MSGLGKLSSGPAPAAEALEARSLMSAAAAGAVPAFDLLVFSKTSGFRHPSIADGVAAIRALGQQNNFSVAATEDATRISDAGLAGLEVVVFLHTTGDFLNATQQAAMERYVRGGGGWVGVHAAAVGETNWAWYGGLLGARFLNEAAPQQAAVDVVDPTHPATAHLPARWTRVDEWYNYRSLPGPDVHVLAKVDETTYTGGNMGANHPIAWYHGYDGGRAFYTGMGHTAESYTEPLFLGHLLGGIRYAAGRGAVADGGRHVFYNNSSFDGNDPAAGAADDGAVAPDKVALLPGQKATFANYTSYSKGINGVMLDVAGLPAGDGPTAAADFVFKAGNDDTPHDWAAAPAPSSVTVRRGAGAGGSDRVTLAWPDGAVKGKWLQVKALVTARTGLADPDVFYFGNAGGDSGNSTVDAAVTPADELGARANQRTRLNPAPLTFRWDYNRDRKVDPADQLIARANKTTAATGLRLITVPAGGAAAVRSASAPRPPVGTLGIAVRPIAWALAISEPDEEPPGGRGSRRAALSGSPLIGRAGEAVKGNERLRFRNPERHPVDDRASR